VKTIAGAIVLAATLGSDISGIPTEEVRAKVRREIAMWAKVVKAAGIKID